MLTSAAFRGKVPARFCSWGRMDFPVNGEGMTTEEAFAGNRLLATIAPADRHLLASALTIVDLDEGDQVLRVGSGVERSVFPFDGLVVSLKRELQGGKTVEVASIGREGAIGGIISCGQAPAFTDASVLLPGKAALVPMQVLETAKQQSPHLRSLFCRYSDVLLAQVMQSVACNAFHPIEARAARWLLQARDRAGSDWLALTQESLAGLLGVQRTTVNAVARAFQEQGMIAYRRGAIQIVDPDKLIEAACDCYGAVEGHQEALIRPSGDS